MMNSKLISKNITINGRRTSLRLEEDMWDSLLDICAREGVNVHDLCTEVDRRRSKSSRTSAVRAFIVMYFRAASTADRRGAKVSTQTMIGVSARNDIDGLIQAAVSLNS